MDRAKGQGMEQRDKRMDKGIEAETLGLMNLKSRDPAENRKA